MTTAVTIDLAGGALGGAGRYRTELTGYLDRRARDDIKVIGASRHLSLGWLAAREATAVRRSRRIATNNVGFLTPGGERYTLLAGSEMAALSPGLRVAMSRQAGIVHRAARRSDVLVAPCTAMAERITAVLPDVADRLVVRMHPVSAVATARPRGGSLILCPVLFAAYKHMADRIGEWLAAVDDVLDDSVRLIVTASPAEVCASLAVSPRVHFVGRRTVDDMRDLWQRSRAVYFPTGLEARASGVPVIARDTPQNREIAGPALCGYTLGDGDSLRRATEAALTARVAPDPGPFDPDAYFDWMLGDNW
jgi:hypothetical protein